MTDIPGSSEIAGPAGVVLIDVEIVVAMSSGRKEGA
jgi:hypothetical protein